MSTNRDIFESVIYVNSEQAQDATENLRKKLEKLNKEYEVLDNAEKKDIKQILKKRSRLMMSREALNQLRKEQRTTKRRCKTLTREASIIL